MIFLRHFPSHPFTPHNSASTSFLLNPVQTLSFSCQLTRNTSSSPAVTPSLARTTTVGNAGGLEARGLLEPCAGSAHASPLGVVHVTHLLQVSPRTIMRGAYARDVSIILFFADLLGTLFSRSLNLRLNPEIIRNARWTAAPTYSANAAKIAHAPSSQNMTPTVSNFAI